MPIKRSEIAIVDDNPLVLKAARDMLMDEHDVVTLPSGEKLFQMLEQEDWRLPDLILLDVMLPEMNGFEILKRMKMDDRLRGIPVIFLTARVDEQSEITGLGLGAVDYIRKPFSPAILKKRVQTQLLLRQNAETLKMMNKSLRLQVREQVATVNSFQTAMMEMIGDLVEFRDSYTGDHIGRTVKLLERFVDALLEQGLYTDTLLGWNLGNLIQSSQLHDIGKINIPDRILLKPGKLTFEEFEVMKTHTTIGEKILMTLQGKVKNNDFLEHARIFAISHHERWDGTGYPKGLKGEEIPLQGRLMTFVDVYDALTSMRPYQDPFSPAAAGKIIRSLKGAQFDPFMTEPFLAVVEAGEGGAAGGADHQ
jgi:putative two-component system response regulator